MGYSKMFVDTSYLIALFVQNDAHYKKALEFLPILEKQSTLYVTNYVLLEVNTVLSQRLGKGELKKAIKFISEKIPNNIHIDTEMHLKTEKKFISLKNKDASFVDINTVLVCETLGIDKILTFDNHFKTLCRNTNVEVITPMNG